MVSEGWSLVTHIIVQELALSPAVQQRQAQKFCLLSLVRSTATDREHPQHIEQPKHHTTRFQLMHLRASTLGHLW